MVDDMNSLLLSLYAFRLIGFVTEPSPGPMAEQPALGQWCKISYPPELIGPFKTRHRRLTGQVKAVNQGSITLGDVAEEQCVISGPAYWRKVPYLSRLTSVTGEEVRLTEDRTFVPDQVQKIEILSDSTAALDRRTIVPRGNKWVRIRIGVDVGPND